MQAGPFAGSPHTSGDIPSHKWCSYVADLEEPWLDVSLSSI